MARGNPIHGLEVVIRTDMPLRDLCFFVMDALRTAELDVLSVGKHYTETILHEVDDPALD